MQMLLSLVMAMEMEDIISNTRYERSEQKQ